MTEAEVKEILNRHLRGGTKEESLIPSQREIYDRVLDKLVGRSLNTDFLRILGLVSKTKSELAFLADFNFVIIDSSDATSILSQSGSSRFLPMYRRFVEIFRFFYENHEQIDWGSHANNWSKKKSRAFIEIIDKKMRERDSEFRQGRSIKVSAGELRAINLGLNFAFRVLLGYEKCVEFVEESNKATSVLKQLQILLFSSPSRGGIS
ncbi:MAG: hypothetical protein A2831_03290 [Candidatus Yanofskybacteria bacterium RIFCSPHIGHO2_01_FULL_44_17]|uniref:Uncharacterized protein n=1 Tax=Candidatus Yanofskybacteria bacterium RIFCSPHIGHO2_01_FULL_44_17 TaxID=1802668 RepID=A0A1F8F0A2_9BACT|nr:MAG: hypothetical protein A2831_03290 [Candidatus Yanofskybacteria bacterium RIFCSPHIGHO2_01_FULL_44_17]